MEALCRNIQTFAPYVDEFLPLLEKDGWEEMLLYLDDISPWISALMPHVDKVLLHFESFVPLVPVMAKNMETFGPLMNDMLPEIDRLLIFLPFVSVADKVGLLKSKVLCSQFVSLLEKLPGAQKKYSRPIFYEELRNRIVYPLPKKFRFVVEVEGKKIVDESKNTSAWFYKVRVVDNDKESRQDNGGIYICRYSVLFSFHERLKAIIDNVALNIASTLFISLQEQYPKFPKKTAFYESFQKKQAVKRAKDLEMFLNKLVQIEGGVIRNIPEFEKFLCTVCVSSLIG